MYILVTKANISQYDHEIKDAEKLYYDRQDGGVESAIINGEMSYIVFKVDGAVGGAKMVNPNPTHPVNTYFENNAVLLQNYWVLEDVFFHVDSDSPIHNDPDLFDELCCSFYKGLYDVIRLSGHQYNKTAVLTMNPYEEHEDIMFFGNWPFSAQHIFDGTEGEEVVLGLLSLSNEKMSAA